MKKNHLIKYLLISPSLPVGGFCYSDGLESYLSIKNLFCELGVFLIEK